jgi:hypothetical protein
MHARANKRRIMQSFYRQFLTWYPSDLGPLTDKDLEAIRRDAANNLPKGELLAGRQPSNLITLLDGFDPKCHGGEAMALTPTGQEFGSPDYEKLAVRQGDPDAL